MYDPTIFDNLKVAIENQLYDYDTIEQQITIRNRKDTMDFAILSREFSITFVLAGKSDIEAEVILRAGIQDFAGEILDEPNAQPACTLALRFSQESQNAEIECQAAEQVLHSIWENEIELKQTITHTYGASSQTALHIMNAVFQKRLTEENMNELPSFLQHVLDTLHVLNRMREGA